MNDAFGVSKGAVGDAVVAAKTKLKPKPKKRVNFALRPLKGMSVLMGVAKGMDESKEPEAHEKAECDCAICKDQGLTCKKCPKCSKRG